MNQPCKVCAEPAAGFHFGAFTCEGCKSFFGRTYNNLSQINECKNGGQCVINKQNRTSCKACRLRKCLVVGMSKTGSRYGRRSNWFKIHCILQEQVAFSNASQSPAFRSPVTPTLQDGSLPFVNSHLRDALHMEHQQQPHHQQQPPLDQGGALTVRIPPISSPSVVGGTALPPPSCTVIGGGGATVVNSVEPNIAATNFAALGQMGAVERRIQEEAALSALRRSAGLPGSDLEASYREQLLEAIRRSHSLQPARQFDSSTLQALTRTTSETEQIRRIGVEMERVRRVSAEAENRLTGIPTYDWDRALQETPTYTDVETTKSPSPHNSKVSFSSNNIRVSECPTTCSQITHVSRRNELEIITKTEKEQIMERNLANRSPSNRVSKFHAESVRVSEDSETPMTEEERLLFLKTASKTTTNNSVIREVGGINSFSGIPSILQHRSTSRDDIPYSPLNNNIFPFTPYPPVWPSILPFPALAKIYPHFNTSAISTPPITFDGFKGHVFSPPQLRAPLLANPAIDISKDDSSNKKRILDAILQVQRESSCGSRSPTGGQLSPPGVSVALSISQHVTSSASPGLPLTASIVTTTAIGDQPIDLTVRRKRKMAKSEIMYQPGDDREEEMESEYERDEREDDEESLTIERMAKEILVKGTSEIVDIKTNLECSTSLSEAKFEVPMKIMKLESSGDTVIV